MSKTKVYVNTKKRTDLSEIFKNIAAGITGVYVFVILTLFPLYTHDMYFDILGARYAFFYNFTLWYLCLLLIFLGISYLIIDYKEGYNSPNALERFIDAFSIKNIKKHIKPTDIFFAIMIFAMIISTVGSNEVMEAAFFGHQGRYQGLQCWFVYFFAYIAVTRTFRFKLMYLDFAIIAGCFSCMWGTTDFFYVDMFKFFVNVSRAQQNMFASSVGNLNTYTNYTVMVFALSAALFIVEKNHIKSFFYLIASLITCTSTFYGMADNNILGLFGFFLFAPFFAFKTRRNLLRYLILICILLFSLFLFGEGFKLPHNEWQFSIAQDLLQKSIVIRYLFIPVTIITISIGIALFSVKPNYQQIVGSNLSPLDSILPKWVYIAYKVFVLFSFLLVVYILLDVNVFKINENLWRNIFPSSNQLVFNDDWGTHRGHNWRIAFTNFTQNFSWFQRLFGFGPDTYQIVSRRTFQEEMVRRYGEVYDSAHNEYVNYLICEGLIGLISYLGILITSIKSGIKKIKDNPYIVAPVLAVIAYAVQAVVNIAIPITTPIFFVLMFMCTSNNEYIEETNNNTIVTR